MPYTLTYDLESGKAASSDNRSRIRLIFQRFGWQAVGGSAVHYPPIGQQMGFEDFFGQVLPALWLFRCLLVARWIRVKSYTFTANSAVAYHHEGSAGGRIVPAAELELVPARGERSTQNKMSKETTLSALEATEVALAPRRSILRDRQLPAC
jgi:hypothetical protein